MTLNFYFVPEDTIEKLKNSINADVFNHTIKTKKKSEAHLAFTEPLNYKRDSEKDKPFHTLESYFKFNPNFDVNKDEKHKCDKVQFFIDPIVGEYENAGTPNYPILNMIFDFLIDEPTISIMDIQLYFIKSSENEISYPNHYKKLFEFFSTITLDDLLNKNYNLYSKNYIKFVRELIISDEGYISFLIHECNNAKNTILKGEGRNSKDAKMFETCGAVDENLKDNISSKIEKWKNETDETAKDKKRKNIYQIILKYLETHRSNESVINNFKHLNYAVIEDEQNTLEVLVNKFDIIFSDTNKVVINNKELETNTFEVLVQKIVDQKPDIVFIDVLYKNEKDQSINTKFIGLDFYEKLRQDLPYSLLVIISSLPENRIKTMLSSIDSNFEKYSLFLSKRYGIDYIINTLDFKQFEEKIKALRKLKSEKNNYFDSDLTGPFKGCENNLIDYINEENENEISWQKKVEIAVNIATKLLNHEKLEDYEKWKKEMSNLEKIKSDFELLKTNLITILIYRLLIFGKLEIEKKHDFEQISYILKDFFPNINYSNFNSFKVYVNRLGISVEKNEIFDDNHNNERNKTTEIKLPNRNLFKHELEFLNIFSNNPSKSFIEINKWYKFVFLNKCFSEFIDNNSIKINLIEKITNINELQVLLNSILVLKNKAFNKLIANKIEEFDEKEFNTELVFKDYTVVQDLIDIF